MVAAKIYFMKFIRHMKIKPKQVKKEQEKRREGKKKLLTFRTDTLHMQVSKIPVVALALILHINKNFFFQRTQFACTTSLQKEKICFILLARTFRTIKCNRTAQEQTLVVEYSCHAKSVHGLNHHPSFFSLCSKNDNCFKPWPQYKTYRKIQQPCAFANEWDHDFSSLLQVSEVFLNISSQALSSKLKNVLKILYLTSLFSIQRKRYKQNQINLRSGKVQRRLCTVTRYKLMHLGQTGISGTYRDLAIWEQNKSTNIWTYLFITEGLQHDSMMQLRKGKMEDAFSHINIIL